MDRLMTKAQKHSGGVSTVVLHKFYSEYNAGQVLNNQYTATINWGTACFAHIPSMLEKAKKTMNKEYRSSDIVEILYLPHFTDRFKDKAEGIKNSLDYLTEVMQFMGVKESPTSIVLEGWLFDLKRSGPWNVGVCSLIRYLSESANRVDAYLYMRRTLKISVPKALFICHFIERVGGGWRLNLAFGGHTLLRARGSKFSLFPKFVNWREQDKGKSILESCDYHGINMLFGMPQGYDDHHGPDSVCDWVNHTFQRTDKDIKEFSKLLKTPRGKKDESTNSKSTGVRKSVRPAKARVHLEPKAVKVVRSGPVHGGVRRRSEPVLIQGTPPDIINPYERSQRAAFIPGGKKT